MFQLLGMKTLILLILYSLINVNHVKSFPTHDSKDDVLINPKFDPRDKKACGLFKPPPLTSGRVWKGEQPYLGQFPWAVCFLQARGPHKFHDLEHLKNELFADITKVQFDIYSIGTYDFSISKGTVTTERVMRWRQFCTGSIIDEYWILTAAHCFTQYWEGMFIVANPGTIECNDGGNEQTKMVIASRLDPFKTIFEHPNFLSSHGQDMGNDIALVRINDGFILPVDSYHNELINRICIYSFNDLPKKGCLRNVYFSGFGKKRDYPTVPDPEDPKSNLTWFKMSRMNDNFCLNHGQWIDEDNIDLVNCYSSVPEYVNLKDSASVKEAGLKNKTAAENYPNTCPGDSGGPFMYYMKYDKGVGQGLQPGYRALLLSTLSGGDWRPGKGNFFCTINWFEEEIKIFGLFVPKTVYFRTIERGTSVRSKIDGNWFMSAMNYEHTGQDQPTGGYAIYPNYC